MAVASLRLFLLGQPWLVVIAVWATLAAALVLRACAAALAAPTEIVLVAESQTAPFRWA